MECSILELPNGLSGAKKIQQTIGNPHVQMLSDDSAVMAYARIVQYQDKLSFIPFQRSNTVFQNRERSDDSAKRVTSLEEKYGTGLE